MRRLFDPSARYLGCDLRPGRGGDVVADALAFVPPETPQTIVCCEVLEHSEQAPALVAHLAPLLPPTGLLLLTTTGLDRAPHSGIDGGPLPGEFYRNWHPTEVLTWCGERVGLRVIRLALTGSDLHLAARATC